ncbi:MAG: hypothetical protein EOP06_04310 [Proteobacteria bacterium]|nr:MAG: hypothetical protein EOP06_04310 [Pseudomonadota bacterium]
MDSNLVRKVALVWVCSAVASKADEDDGNVFSMNRREIVQPQTDILESIPLYFESLGLSIDKWLPINKAEEFLIAVESSWDNKLTVEELDSFDNRSVSRLAGLALGMGISPEDETDTAEFLSERGVNCKKVSSLMEIEYEIDNFVWQMEEAIQIKEAELA